MEDSLIEKLKFSEVFPDSSIKRLKDNSELLPDIGEYKSGEIVHLTGEKCDRVEILISGEALVQSLTEQIINFLKAQFDLQNSFKINLPVTINELANRFGVRRTSLSRELAKMKRRA